MRRIVLVVGVVCVAGLGALWQRVAVPAQESTTPLKVGVLDSAKITREVQNLALLKRTYDEQRRAYLELIALRQNFLMLTGLEWADLRRLLSRPQRSRSDEQRIQELRRIALEREVELQRLQQTPPEKLTPQERTRLEQLTQLWKEGRGEIERLKGLMDEELRRIEAQLNRLVDEKLQQAIRKVAAEQGLDIVLDKSVVFFVRGNPVDITEATVSVLTEMLQSSEGATPDAKEAKP